MRRRSTTLAAAIALAVLASACGGGDGGDGGLAAVEGTEPPEAYRVVYEVTTPEGRGQEELVVHRPFTSSVTERDADGAVVSRRISALGLLVTVRDDEATAVETAVAPAASDLRPDRFTARLVDAGRLERGEDGEVGGRTCRGVVQPDAVATDGSGGAGGTGTFPVRIERCVDAMGIVLQERITTPGGQAVRTKRAVELDVGDDVPDLDAIDVEPLPQAQGGGSVEELTGDRPPGAPWQIRPPDGFERIGTYAVRPATLGTSPRTDAQIELVTDVWRRGPDLLLLDQGRASAGTTPFDPATEVEAVQLGDGVGAAVLALDLRLAEVRITGSDGGFLRVAGTLPVDDLLAVARTLRT